MIDNYVRESPLQDAATEHWNTVARWVLHTCIIYMYIVTYTVLYMYIYVHVHVHWYCCVSMQHCSREGTSSSHFNLHILYGSISAQITSKGIIILLSDTCHIAHYVCVQIIPSVCTVLGEPCS